MSEERAYKVTFYMSDPFPDNDQGREMSRSLVSELHTAIAAGGDDIGSWVSNPNVSIGGNVIRLAEWEIVPMADAAGDGVPEP